MRNNGLIFLIVFVLFGSSPSWAQNIKDGQGTLTTAHGEQYTGEFKNGLYDGNGVLVYTDGSKYEGQFKKGLLNGQGVITYADGTQFKGKFKDGDIESAAPAATPNSPAGNTQKSQ